MVGGGVSVGDHAARRSRRPILLIGRAALLATHPASSPMLFASAAMTTIWFEDLRRGPPRDHREGRSRERGAEDPPPHEIVRVRVAVYAAAWAFPGTVTASVGVNWYVPFCGPGAASSATFVWPAPVGTVNGAATTPTMPVAGSDPACAATAPVV